MPTVAIAPTSHAMISTSERWRQQRGSWTEELDLTSYTTSMLPSFMPSFARGVPLASDWSSAGLVPLLAANRTMAECPHGSIRSATTRLYTSGTKKSSGVASSSYVNLRHHERVCKGCAETCGTCGVGERQRLSLNSRTFLCKRWLERAHTGVEQTFDGTS